MITTASPNTATRVSPIEVMFCAITVAIIAITIIASVLLPKHSPSHLVKNTLAPTPSRFEAVPTPGDCT